MNNVINLYIVFIYSASRSLCGCDSSARVTYSVSVGGNAGTLVCAHGYSASSDRFIGLGCGHGSFSRTLAWGNNIGMPKIKCLGNPFGVFVQWSF